MTTLINLFSKPGPASQRILEGLKTAFSEDAVRFSSFYDPEADLNLVVGGDGTFLQAVHTSRFSSIPFLGINTGSLGFFQESDLSNLKKNILRLKEGQFAYDDLLLLRAKIRTDSWTYERWCVNEFAVKGDNHKTVHLSLAVDEIPLIDMAGDGLLLSTPSGSTAYNLSAGGAILYQTLKGYQVTPIAPLRSKSYRALPAPIVLPDQSLCRVDFPDGENDHINLVTDGASSRFLGLKSMEFTAPGKTIRRITFSPNWYWYNLKEKLI